MDRRSFFRFLPAVPVGIAGAALAKEPDNIVRASPEQRCHCGCPTHFAKIDLVVNAAPAYGGLIGPRVDLSAGTKEVCAWCGADWNVKGPYKGA